MTIPKISRTNVLAAINQIKKEGVPASRHSTRYYLEHEDHIYPPKYVLSLAAQYATGRQLKPEEFSGGLETNSLLRRLGFSVVAFSRDAADRECARPRSTALPSTGNKVAHQAKSLPVSSRPRHTPPLIGRVVVRGWPPGDASEGEAMLLDVLGKQWPHGMRLRFLITPGGFVEAQFPVTWNGGVSWNSRPGDLDALVKHASKVLRRTFTERVRKAAKGKIDVLTVGIDLFSEDDQIQEHAELVAVCELSSRRVFWTGKSYPTRNQERHLVQVADLRTHLLEVGNERVLVLGCHDLNMFSPRVRASLTQGSVRWKRCKDMRSLARRFKPTIVLQHPHSTDTPNIWRIAWIGLVREHPTLKAWASGIAYSYRGGTPRGALNKVLVSTQGGAPSVDFVTSVR